MEVRGKYKGNSTCRAKALRLGVSRQTSRRRTNFPTKELRSKRRISPCIFQAHQYLDLPTSRSRIASGEWRSREPRDRPTSYPGYFLLFSVHGHLLRKYPGIVWSRVSQNLGGNNTFLSGWVTK